MQRNFIEKGVRFLGVAAALGWIGSCAPQNRSLDPFPSHVLTELALRKHEAPAGYALITSRALLKQAGISKNPDYLTRRAALEDIIQMDGAAAFIALYGPEDSVRLMVKGVFFREPQQAVKYAHVQRTRQRLVTAYRLVSTGGVWLLFIACDPDLTYDETEQRLIRQGLKAYQRRLTLESLFNLMDTEPGA